MQKEQVQTSQWSVTWSFSIWKKLSNDIPPSRIFSVVNYCKSGNFSQLQNFAISNHLDFFMNLRPDIQISWIKPNIQYEANTKRQRSITFKSGFLWRSPVSKRVLISYIGWRKPKSDHEEDSPSEVTTLENQTSKSDSTFHRHGLKGKMSFKTASQATLTFLSARRRIEGGLKSLAKKAQKAEHTKGILVMGCGVSLLCGFCMAFDPTPASFDRQSSVVYRDYMLLPWWCTWRDKHVGQWWIEQVENLPVSAFNVDIVYV